MYRCTVGTKNPGRCREVAVIERWPLVEVRLYILPAVIVLGEQHSGVVMNYTQRCWRNGSTEHKSQKERG